jgi:hypothetical protein
MIWPTLLAPLRDKPEADRRRAKPYNIVRDISTNGSGQWRGGAYLVKAAPRDPKILNRRREK